MGLYYRTVEMSRRLTFACYRCGPDDAAMTERLVSPTELELTHERCGLVMFITTTAAIPKRPDEIAGVIRYRPGQAIDHGSGFRCHNCGRRLAHDKEGKGPHQCPRCHSWHFLGSVTEPPRRPRVLRSASTASSSPVATPASSAP